MTHLSPSRLIISFIMCLLCSRQCKTPSLHFSCQSSQQSYVIGIMHVFSSFKDENMEIYKRLRQYLPHGRYCLLISTNSIWHIIHAQQITVDELQCFSDSKTMCLVPIPGLNLFQLMTPTVLFLHCHLHTGTRQ